MRRARKINPNKFKERERIANRLRPHNERYWARIMVHAALKMGTLKKPKTCSICFKEKKLTAHHKDYEKPLNVQWLCYECHGNK